MNNQHGMQQREKYFDKKFVFEGVRTNTKEVCGIHCIFIQHRRANWFRLTELFVVTAETQQRSLPIHSTPTHARTQVVVTSLIGVTTRS